MFDKLNAYEKAIVMFFAINYGNEITLNSATLL